ncbi:putative redoxin [Lyophyllum shimeji]|uniref:thioredoxin-dependent peroxiredoxin n=1 Tax=Lyophyllum shimeji TaxID=47721 RepID=A0A9P3PN46_LYOSH|nr:putative redoxin [Lyophyllum shimeji]
MSHHTLIGKQAPAISLPNYTGETFTLKPGETGVPTVLFFYPSSGSYGCTKEACQFRDAIAEKDTFKPGKVRIIGLSRDPVEKQKEFVEKEKLTYPVLSDVDGEAVKAYGVGKGLMGFAAVARVTIIIDKNGVVRDTLDTTINYAAHSKFVAKWLEKLEEEDAASAAPPPTETITVAAPQPEVTSEEAA